MLKNGNLSEVLEPDRIITEEMMAYTYGVDVRLIEHETIGRRKVLVPILKKENINGN